MNVLILDKDAQALVGWFQKQNLGPDDALNTCLELVAGLAAWQKLDDEVVEHLRGLMANHRRLVAERGVHDEIAHA